MLDDISIGKIVEWVRTFEDYTSTSLPQYTKRCIINSRVYLQKDIAEEEIISDLLKNLHNIYIGYILTAVQMNTYVSGNRTIRDLMSTVATENLIGDEYIGLESFGDDFDQTFSPTMARPFRGDKRTGGRGSGAKSIDLKDQAFPSGRIIEVSFTSPKDPKATFSVNMFVQLLPRIIPHEVAEQFVALNFKPSLKKRWLQYKTGEISFWKDFVSQMDLLKKRRKALKRDRTGDLKHLMDVQQNSLVRQLLKLVGFYPDMQNIANSIMILEKQSFDRFCTNNHYSFKRYGDRQKFFSKSYAMALATVDPQYNRVELFLNGIDAKCEYSFTQLIGSAKKESLNLVTLMSQMSQGQAPKF